MFFPFLDFFLLLLIFFPKGMTPYGRELMEKVNLIGATQSEKPPTAGFSSQDAQGCSGLVILTYG